MEYSNAVAPTFKTLVLRHLSMERIEICITSQMRCGPQAEGGVSKESGSLVLFSKKPAQPESWPNSERCTGDFPDPTSNRNTRMAVCAKPIT